MASNDQMTANQQNAKLSTGPKTEAGKIMAAKNSIKHGILSRWVVLENEDQTEYDNIKRGFVEDLKPVGAIEEMLVERMASCYWRLQRVMIAEKGSIKKRYDNGWFRRIQKRVRQAEKYVNSPLLYSYKAEKLSNSISAEKIIVRLKELRKTVDEMGYLPNTDRDEYVAIMNMWQDENQLKGLYFFCELAEGKIPEEENGREKGKKALLFILDKEIESAEKLLSAITDIEKEDDQAEAMTNLVPDSNSIDTLGRYETALERGMYQALMMLGKLREGKLAE
jgi:hypothetical protein